LALGAAALGGILKNGLICIERIGLIDEYRMYSTCRIGIDGRWWAKSGWSLCWWESRKGRKSCLGAGGLFIIVARGGLVDRASLQLAVWR
jgi:hypothetical protein